MTNRQPKLHIFTTGILVFPYKHGPSQEFSVSVSNTCTFFPGLGSKYRSPAWCLSFSPSVSPPVLAHTSLLLFLCSQPATRHRHLGSITTATTVLTSLLASSWCPMTVKGPNCTAGVNPGPAPFQPRDLRKGHLLVLPPESVQHASSPWLQAFGTSLLPPLEGSTSGFLSVASLMWLAQMSLSNWVLSWSLYCKL